MSNPEFIETEGSLERVNKVLNGIRSGNPILLEGETGTSKTRTAIVASQRNKQTPIVINFSSQTTIEDLIGRISKDTDSWGGFSFTNGPYTEAFMNGNCLILDEINLAYENVLQCIEASLDSGKLFLEISGSETKVIHKHPNFHLIATLNPLTGRFSQKRQFLSQKFRSRFQTITFSDIKEDELQEIAKGLAKDLPDSEDTIEKLIKFHFDWKKNEANENQIHVFTIREISGTIKSIKEGLSPFESILIHYGSRYDIKKLQIMIKKLISFGFEPTDSSLTLPKYDQKLFYMTESLQRSLLNSSHLLQTCHPILITGPDGCGKTSFARWIAQIYNSQTNQSIEEEEEEEEKNEVESTESIGTSEQKETESNEQNEKTESNEQSEKTESNEQNEKTESNEQSEKTESNEQNEKTESNEQNEKTESNEPKEAESNEQNEKAESNELKEAESNEQNEKTESNEQNEKTESNEPKEAESTRPKGKKHLKKAKQNNRQNTTNVFICNPEVSISDIIGRYTPVMGASGEAPIQWIDGPVVASLRKGDCLIMDQIDTASSTILERLNSLYDNFGVKDSRFSVQENSEEDSILIHPNFRIIATSSYEGLNDISPALLNRFTIIYIDDQLVELLNDEEKLINFVQHISIQSPQKSDIKLIAQSAIRNKDEMTISRISKIVRGFFSLKKEIPRALSKSVLDFCISATSSSTDLPALDESFVTLLLSLLNEDKGDSTFDSFLFKEASATRQIMAVLVAAYIAGFHVVLIGKTGLGKTSAAIALSRLYKYSKGRQFISFNGETQLEELFGYFTIEKGNFTSHSGPLSDAMEEGKIFIADELNLADQMIIQSLNVAIEPSKNDQIILPVIGRNIIVNENFFFIGCQNDISMYGRKPLPPQFQKKVLCIKYPENSRTDLLSLTTSLARQFNLKPEFSSGTTEMIEKMKQDPVFQKKVWSLREVRRLFRRTNYTSSHTNSMIGFSIYTNAAFLLRSAFRDTENISEKAVDLVSSAFGLSKIQSASLKSDLDAEVKVFKMESKSQIQLKKNRLSLTITNSELLKIPEELQSFWQTLFEVGITHPSEPLLLVGPSGFKTYLAKAVCPRSPVVYLHSDTTIPSLIGQITLLDKDQARNFLLDSLYNFAGPAPPDEFKVLFKEIRELEMIDIEKIQDVKKFINNESFNDIVDNIIQQLIDIDNQTEQNLNSAFSNYYSVFKPGLITKHILKQNSLILRNIAQPSPTVLERLNELLSITPTLTLFEDTSNTIVPPNGDKVLSKFSNNFRIIGICLPREKRGLSEAMLSRLTEISVPKYTNQDQEKVIDSILLQSNLNNDKSFDLYKKLLGQVSQIFIDQKEELSMSIPFTRIIEIVRTSIAWRTFFSKYNKVEKEETLFSLALFRCAAGPIPYETKKAFLKAFYNEKSGFEINEELKKLFEDKIDEGTSPNDFLSIEEEDDQKVVRSSISKMFMPSPLSRLPESNFCFTSSTKDLVDVIISASIINHPLILEGPNGSGKSSTILYLSKCVDANVVRISISSSTTVEDLFGKYEPNTSSKSLKFDFQPTNFLNAIRYDRDNTNDDFSPLKKQWIIIEELHLASASVLDSLAPVFNQQTDQLFLSDGQIAAKRDYFIVGLISQPLQNQSIINTSMIYKTRDYSKSEYDQIYKFILSNNNFDEDICTYFSDQMYALTKLSLSSQSKIPITVREVHKFLNLFEGSEGKMDIEKIVRTLCLGRFTNNEFIENAKVELGYNDDNYTLPNISIEMGSSTLRSDGIPMHINTSSSRSHYEIQYLSSSEKELFVFLSMSLKKYTPIIIQGPTASGKTYSVQLFADIIGRPLRTIQLNSEITSQSIAGTFQPSKNLSMEEMDKLQEALHSISDLPNLPQEFADKIQNEDISDWLPKHFKQLRSIIQNNIDQYNASDKAKALYFIKEVDNLLQFYNHLKRTDSVIIKAMTEGSLLLLDGIEAAPADFFDRLTTLIDNNPSLNLYERGNGFFYSRDSENPERRIHPNFRLIMTYNPVDLSSASNLSPSLLSKCTIFSMKSIDSNLNDSSLIIFGFLNQIDFRGMEEDTSEISIKLGKSHMAAKEFTNNSQFSVTGRTLIHLCHNLEYKSTIEEIDYDNLKDIIDFIYGSLMSDSDKFLEAVDEKFEQTIDINILEFIKKAQLSTSKGCLEIINLIDNFMSEFKENNQTKFDFETFLGWLLQLHLKDIETVHDKVRYILINFLKQSMSELKENIEDINTARRNLFAHCSAIRCLEVLVNEIRQACQEDSENEFTKNATLNSPQVQEIAKFQVILKKIRSILYLIQNGLFIMQSIPILFYDNARKEFLTIMEEIEEKKPLNELFDSIKELKNNEDSKNLINFQENPIFFIDSMIHFYESNNWPPKINTVSRMISSCIFFDDPKCQYLFKGISRTFFNILESILNDDSDISTFINLIDYISLFYKLLEIDSSITLEGFVSLFEQRSYDSKQFNKFFQNLRTINNRIAIKSDDQRPINEIEEIKPIANAVDSLYQDYNEKYARFYLQGQKDQDAAKEFLQIVENINNRLETEKILKVPYELFVRLTDNMEINTESFAFLKNIYLSIKEVKEPKIKSFEWPHEHVIKFSDETPSFPLIESLINYSKKEQIDFQSANWMTLCSIEKNAEYFLKQFLEKSISQESIMKYQSVIKAQLLCDLSKIPETDKVKKYGFCSRNSIVKFFNEISNRSAEVNQTYIDLAHYYEINMDRNFVISIPTFTSEDTLSMLVNPIDFSPGPLFNDVIINLDDQEFLANSYENLKTKSLFEVTQLYLADAGIQTPEVNSLEDICRYVTSKSSIENHVQNMVQTFFIAYQISKVAISKEKPKNLQFNDIPDEFNSDFIDKHPFCGFYLAIHPEVKPEIERISKLIGKSSFPLSLFTFRLYSNQDIVEIKLPSTFPSGLSQDVEDFILQISTVITTNYSNGKITKFSNLIGFLLDQVPLTIDTQQSEHFREILLDLISKPKDPILLEYVMRYLHDNIEKMILTIGSNEWNDLIVADYNKNKSDFLKFLMNPWEKALQSIENTFLSEKSNYDDQIRKILDYISNQFTYKYNNRGFFNSIFDAKTKDETELQTKIREEYKRVNQQMKVNSVEESMVSNLNKAWISYCSYVVNALNQLKDFPSTSNGRFPDNSFFEPFHKHFDENSGFTHPTSEGEVTLIVFILKDKAKQDVTISYTNGKQQVYVTGKINNISIMKLPSNLSISDLNIQSNDVEIEYDNVRYDSSAQPRKGFKMKEMLDQFNKYKDLVNQNEESNDDDDEATNNKFGKIEVLFNNKNYDEFVLKITELSKKAKSLIAASGSLKELSKSSNTILTEIKEIECFFPANFVDNTETPKQTNALLEQFINFINQSERDLNQLSIPDEIINADEQIIINKNSEFNQILGKAKRFAKKPTPVISDETTQYEVKEINCKEPEKLIIPTIFIDGTDYCLNITRIYANLGPFYKGCPYTQLKFRIINLTKQNIRCTFQQDDQITGLSYENANGFFFLVFPIDKIAFDYNEDSELKFTGTISFYEMNSETAFKEVPYDISMYFLSPNIYLNIKNQSFAIKDGEAQILPYYAVQNSNLELKVTPYFRQLKFVELPENTAKKPQQPSTVNNNITLTLPTRNKEEHHLSIQLDFGLSNNMTIPLSLNVDLYDEQFSALMYDDRDKRFVQNNAIATIGNLWRDIYILVSYYNPKSTAVDAVLSFQYNSTRNFEISKPKPISFQPYSHNVELISFKARTISSDFRIDDPASNQLTISIGTNKKIIDFTFSLSFIYHNRNTNKLFTSKSIRYCSYWEDNTFKEYDFRIGYTAKDVNLILSPISMNFYQSDSKHNVGLKFDKNGELVRVYDSNNFKEKIFNCYYEILTLDLNTTDTSKQIQIIKKRTPKLKEGELRLFARLEGRPDTVFPLFGQCESLGYNFDAPTYNYNDYEHHFTSAFVVWFEEFLQDQDKNKYYISASQDNKFVCLKDDLPYPSTHNLAYLISYMTQNIDKVPYVSLIKAIKNFTQSDIIEEKYNEAYRQHNILEWKLVCLVWAINETMLIQYRDLKVRHFIVDFPVSADVLLNEQKKLMQKCRIDEETMRKTDEFRNLKDKKKNIITNFNDQQKSSFVKNGFSISSYAKWTYENKFQEIEEAEFPKTPLSQKQIKEEIKPEYSNEAGNIDITNTSFKNMNSIMNIYKAFDSILRNTYQFTISFHSSLKKNKDMKHNIEILNQLVSFYLWARDIKDYSPYSLFLDRFFSAYQSMITRLRSSGITIRPQHYDIKNTLLSDNDFLIRPQYQTSLEIARWLQPGKNKKPTQEPFKKDKENNKKKGKKPESNKHIYRPNTISTPEYDDINKFISPLNQGHGRNPLHGEIIQKISRESINNASKEIPNKDYIEYIVNKMTNPGKEKKIIQVFDDDKTHIPVNYDTISNNLSTEAVDFYFDAADALTGLILDGLGEKSPVLDNCNDCYASILIDCSNTFSEIQKASLILLSIAYGNSLTALRIPYSIVIYCDDNFQFILKKLEDNHDKIFFSKLIEAMTVNRRMSSMTDAIQMAISRVVPSPTGQYTNRKNHVIYVLSDGLSTLLDATQQWNKTVLNYKSVAVSFFFLNIISGEFTQAILDVWSRFAKGIATANSPTTVFYSTFDNILENKDFYRVLSSDQESPSIIVPISECFGQPIIQSVPKDPKKYPHLIRLTKEPKKAQPLEFDSNSAGLVLDLLNTSYSDENKFYRDGSDPVPLDDPLDVEITEMKIEPFSILINTGESQKNREYYSAFYKRLFDPSSETLEQSLVQEMSSMVFIPNKPSQYTPSSDGTLFYFPGLIRFLLTQGQDTKIFLEKKAGLLKSYSVFIVIDCSISCFNVQSAFHAFQSLFILLQTLSKIDLPSFNLIITTNDGPLILCSEKSTFDALSSRSPVWLALFTYLLNPHPNSCLDSALLSMLSIRAQEKTLSSVLFIFTDGNFSSKEQKVYNSILEKIYGYNVEAVTIGIGSYSSNICSLATKKVWSINPRNVIKGILSVFGKESSELIEKIPSMFTGIPFDKTDIITKLSGYLKFNTVDDYSFKELIIELNNITRDISVFKDFYNIQPDGTETFLEDDSHDIGKMNFYKGIKILICQFWDQSMTSGEDPLISKEVLLNGTDESKKSVINSLKEFGIETVIVQNYKEAIREIKSGEYSEVWVICGRHDGKMPDNSEWARLSSQFIDCLIIYWENGGGIVFWTDNSPLTAEANFFLSKANFGDDKEEVKAGFRIGGSYPGGKMLRRSDEPRVASFTAEQTIQCDGYQKLLFNANMKRIYEGITIASAIIPPENPKSECYNDNNYTFAYTKAIKPFRYFSVSSSRGISSLYYTSPLNSKKGDIVIDCGFSKLFFELTTEGIYWYVRNIAIFMISLEKKTSMIGGSADPRKFKPKPFEFNIRPYCNPEPKFYQYNDERFVDIVFLIDGTGSMMYFIDAVKNSCNDIAKFCKQKFTNNTFRFGCVIYRDNAVKAVRNKYLQHSYKRYNNDETEACSLSTNINDLYNFLSNVEAKGGGGDGPEDWLSGYQRLKKLNWKIVGKKIVIHIADAPGHGQSFHGGRYTLPHTNEGQPIDQQDYVEMDKEHDKEFPEYIKWAANYGIKFFCLSASYLTFQCFVRTQQIYTKAGGEQFKITRFDDYNGDNISDKQKQKVIDIVKQVAMESVDDSTAVPTTQEEETNNITTHHNYSHSSQQNLYRPATTLHNQTPKGSTNNNKSGAYRPATTLHNQTPKGSAATRSGAYKPPIKPGNIAIPGQGNSFNIGGKGRTYQSPSGQTNDPSQRHHQPYMGLVDPQDQQEKRKRKRRRQHHGNDDDDEQ